MSQDQRTGSARAEALRCRGPPLSEAPRLAAPHRKHRASARRATLPGASGPARGWSGGMARGEKRSF
eukprot:2388886-Alexandrium_andersonii.AAC.1